MADELQMPEPHTPVDVTESMHEAAEPTDERISRPSNAAAVRTIAKRVTVPREE